MRYSLKSDCCKAGYKIYKDYCVCKKCKKRCLVSRDYKKVVKIKIK